MATYRPSRPRCARSTAASHTISGVGSIDTGTSPLVETSCQMRSSATGMSAPPTMRNQRRSMSLRRPDAAARSRRPPVPVAAATFARRRGDHRDAVSRPATRTRRRRCARPRRSVDERLGRGIRVGVMGFSWGGGARITEAGRVGLRDELSLMSSRARRRPAAGSRRRRARRRSGRSSRAPRPARHRARCRRRGWCARR